MKKVVVGIIPRLNSAGSAEFLLMSSKTDFGKYTGCYYPPGGHMEGNEDEFTALTREIDEELGLYVVPLTKLGESEGDVVDQTTSWWVCCASIRELTLQVDEVADARWFTKEEIIQSDKVWPATKKFFENFQVGRAVSAGGVIVKNENGATKLLFVTFPNGGLVLPKGHIEAGETLEQAALREVEEESGLTNVRIISKLGVINRPSEERDGSIVLKDIHYYLMETDSFDQTGGDENTSWFTIEEALPHLLPQEADFLTNIKLGDI